MAAVLRSGAGLRPMPHGTPAVRRLRLTACWAAARPSRSAPRGPSGGGVSRRAALRLPAAGPPPLARAPLRGPRLVRRATATIVAGANRLVLPVGTLRPGRYRLNVSARDATGQ